MFINEKCTIIKDLHRVTRRLRWDETVTQGEFPYDREIRCYATDGVLIYTLLIIYKSGQNVKIIAQIVDNGEVIYTHPVDYQQYHLVDHLLERLDDQGANLLEIEYNELEEKFIW